jgi:hypothetical protein
MSERRRARRAEVMRRALSRLQERPDVGGSHRIVAV